jgi:hsp70-interacting protein
MCIDFHKQALAVDSLPKLAKLVSDPDAGVRKKAIRAISSEIRNYQPALTETLKHLPKDIVGEGNFNADDMDSVDSLINALRERSAKMAQ